jgi:tetratricopeptide (TPR) repeat protein
MKKISMFASFLMIISCALSGQDFVEKICNSVCSCIDTIENMDSLQSKLDRCVPEAVSQYFESDSDEDPGFFGNQDSIKNTVDKVMNKLVFYCPKIKEFILANKEMQYYKMSDSKEANDFYSEGNKALKSKDYKSAEKNFLKAIRLSPGWVLPLDDLGVTYRQMGEYKKAIRYYEKSLAIFPEGSYALQDQAVSYMYLKDYEKALQNYNVMINLYPGNPEGYYGKGKILILTEDYENALANLLYCHKLYAETKSDYVNDTKNLIALIYSKMKEKDKLDDFNRIIEKFGVKINTADQ